MKKIIFSDLDGTLLDYNTYSIEKSKKALNIIQKKDIPLILCSSKTRNEINYWQKKIGITDPFISENGGGIFIPIDYFSFKFDYNEIKEDFYIIELGLKYNQLIKFYEEIKQKYKIIGFSDMTIEEIAKDANLNLDQAEMAKKRDFDLPFKILNKSEKKDIFREIKQKGLNYTIGGRYYHLIADNDKGRAVKVLSNLFKREFNEIYSIGIGDSENDFPMLDEVESPYLVQRKNGTYASDKYYLSDGIGPIGWTKVIESELK